MIHGNGDGQDLAHRNGVVALGICDYARTLLDGVNGKGRGLGRNDLQEGTTALVLSVNRAYVGDGCGALLNIFLGQAIRGGDGIIFFLLRTVERGDLVGAGFGADQPHHRLCHLALFQSLQGVVQRYLVHDLVHVGIARPALGVHNGGGHFAEGLIAHIAHVDGHHLSVRQQHGHGHINVVKIFQAPAHQAAIKQQVCVHGRRCLQPLADDFHHHGIQSDLFLPAFAVGIQRFDYRQNICYICLVHHDGVGDLPPALCGHVGYDFACNAKVFFFNQCHWFSFCLSIVWLAADDGHGGFVYFFSYFFDVVADLLPGERVLLEPVTVFQRQLGSEFWVANFDQCPRPFLERLAF